MLIVIFARTVVEAEGKFDLSMLVLPVSILFIAAALRLIDFAGSEARKEEERRAKTCSPRARDASHDPAGIGLFAG